LMEGLEEVGDPDVLEAAMQHAEDTGAAWRAPFVEWIYEDRDDPLTMADVVAYARVVPQLATAWTAAEQPVEDPTELVPLAEGGRALVLANDNATPLDFVAEQIRAHTGLGPLESVRLAMVAHDHGRVRIAVPEPARVARRIIRAARSAGYPLRAEAA
ncbi:MAG: ATP-dependent Clp protease adaptor ClpS, partial [Myxococcota bacterium]